MLQDAIVKLKSEMDQNNNNPYIQYVGAELIRYAEAKPEFAEKFLAQDKTIGKSLENMRKVAEKKKVGNIAMLTPDEGMKVVFEYFGLNKLAATPQDHREPVPVIQDNTVEAKAPEINFDIDIDDLL